MTSLRFRTNRGGARVGRTRFLLVKGAVIFFFMLLGARLVYVQGFLRSELRERADRQFSRHLGSTDRNRILDRNGAVLAETVQVMSCFADPTLIRNRTSAARELASLLGVDESRLAAKLKGTKGSFVWVKRDVSPSAVTEIRRRKISGIGFRPETRRSYPEGPIASHLLGMVGFDGHGLSGVEQAFERTLSPDSTVKDRAGSEGLPSGDVQLTIDAGIQKIVERELDWGARKTGAKRAIAMVQDPWTGEIIATAAWPFISLDPDEPPAPADMRIPEVVDVFEPGSTFKIVTAAAALEEKVVKRTDHLDGENGKWMIMGITIHDHEPVSDMTFDDFLIRSSNIGAAKIADRLGSERLFHYARLFGFGVFPACGIGTEAKGLLRTPSQWSGVSKYIIAFGQEVGVTAVQIVDAYSTIANGGRLLEPRLVHAVLDPSGNPLWSNETGEVRRVVSEKTADNVKQVLAEVVEKGTGVNAQIAWDPAMKVAGKTGTAQKYNRALHRYDDNLSLVSFSGFFPVDHPAYTVFVMLDEPQGRSFGGLDAAPIFRRIAEQISPRIVNRKALPVS